MSRENNLDHYYFNTKRQEVPSYVSFWDIRNGDVSRIEGNDPWEGTLQLKGFVRGRSAARLDWLHIEDGRGMEMFMSDAEDVLMELGVEPGGKVHGLWRFVKRGANYGVQMAPNA